MTRAEKNAKIEEFENEMNEVKEHRKHSGPEDKLLVNSIALEKERDENEKLKLEVTNSDAITTELSNAGIKLQGSKQEKGNQEKQGTEKE